MKKKTHEEFTKEVFDIVGTEYAVMGNYVNTDTHILMKHNLCGHEWNVRPTLFLSNASRCPACSAKNKTKTHDKYVAEIYELVGDEYSVMSSYISSRKHVSMKHNLCGYEWDVRPYSFLCGSRCPKCARNFEIVIGKNDLWTTHPHCAKLLKNLNDGFKYSHGSRSKVDWICPECGIVINKKISAAIQNGLCCRFCSRYNSFPNRFMGAILDSLGVYYIAEKTFDWSNRKKYDFYVPDKNLIIEMFGLQHYEQCYFRKNEKQRTLQEEQENDSWKESIAKKHGVKNYFIIDSRKSEIEWIKQSLIESDLSKIIDFTNIDWDDCYHKSFSSRMMQAVYMWNNGVQISEISQKLKVVPWTIRSYLYKASSIGLCNYEKQVRLSSAKQVISLQTLEVFSSAKEAGLNYGLSDGTNITRCCRGTASHAGWNESIKEYMKWQYYEDYLNKIGGAA